MRMGAFILVHSERGKGFLQKRAGNTAHPDRRKTTRKKKEGSKVGPY